MTLFEYLTAANTLILSFAVSFSWRFSENNGALNAYVFWVGTIIVELVILGRAVRRPGAEDSSLPPPVRSPRESAAG